MIGQYQHNIDAKGRLFIPAKYREELGETFYVTIGLDGCLSVYSDAKWADLTAKFDALPISQARKMRALFANAAKCEPDAQGRILIPAKLRQYAALEREVVINGASKCLELWNPERWAPIEDAGLDPENLAAAMGLPVENVGVKATTTEHLGPEGREEGITGYATCLVYRAG